MTALGCPVLTWVEDTFLPEVGPCHLVGPAPDAEQLGSLNSVTSPAALSLCLPVPEVSNLPEVDSSVYRGDQQSLCLTGVLDITESRPIVLCHDSVF